MRLLSLSLATGRPTDGMNGALGFAPGRVARGLFLN